MHEILDGLLACPYCQRPLQWAHAAWFGRGGFACDQCGDFPDFSGVFEQALETHDLGDKSISAWPPDGAARDTPPRVLIVDDSREQCDLYAFMLERSAAVAVASRGDEGLAMAAIQPPDVILLDVMMPGMDGWEVCQRLKADLTTAGIPIVMLTSLDDTDVPARARQAGAMAVLMKPCPVERLVLTINAAARSGASARRA